MFFTNMDDYLDNLPVDQSEIERERHADELYICPHCHAEIWIDPYDHYCPVLQAEAAELRRIRYEAERAYFVADLDGAE